MSSAITGMLFMLFFLIIIASPFLVLPYAISFIKSRGVNPGQVSKPLAAIAAVGAVAIGYALVTVPYLYLILLGLLMGLLILGSPFIALALATSHLVRRRFRSRRLAAAFIGLSTAAAFVCVWFAVFALLDTSTADERDPVWLLELIGALALVSIPVALIATAIGWNKAFRTPPDESSPVLIRH